MSLGPSEIFLVVLVILLLFGGKKLPEVARNLGKGIAEVRRYTVEMKRELNTNITEPSTISSKPAEDKRQKTEQPTAPVNANPTAQPGTSATKPDSTD